MSLKASYFFIHNPFSGPAKHAQLPKQVAQHFKACDYRFEQSSSEAHLVELAIEARDSYHTIIVVAGGDGTVRLVARHLLNVPNKAIYIIPTGSGNGLARQMGYKASITKHIQWLLNPGSLQSIPIQGAFANEHFFINIAGLGFDAAISKAFSKNKRRGFLGYALQILKHLPYKPALYSLEYEGKHVTLPAFLIAIANGSEWGNGAVIAPGAKLSAPRLEVVVVKPLKWYAIPRVLYRIFTGQVKPGADFICLNVSEITVTNSYKQPLHLDGDWVPEPHTTWYFGLKGALHALVPSHEPH